MNNQFKSAKEEFYYLYSKQEVSELYINSKDEMYYEECGKLFKSKMSFGSDHEIMDIIKEFYKESDRKWTSDIEIDAFSLANSNKMSIILPPISTKGPSIVIRKFPPKILTFDDLLAFKSITNEGLKILKSITNSYKGLLLSGGVGSGKITFANCFAMLIPERHRLVLLEKSKEMVVTKNNVLHLQSKMRSSESFIELIQFGSELRADVLMINSIDGAEVSTVIELGRGGHTVYATLHAEDTIDALRRVELMYMRGDSLPRSLEIKNMISSVFTYTMHIKRLPDGGRVVSSISSIDGTDENENFIVTPLYWFDEEKREHQTTVEGLKLIDHSKE